MKQLSSVDPTVLMNIVGALTSNDDFEGYNGQSSKEPWEFFTALLDLLVNEEMTDYGLYPGQEDRTMLGSLFQCVIGQEVRVPMYTVLALIEANLHRPNASNVDKPPEPHRASAAPWSSISLGIQRKFPSNSA